MIATTLFTINLVVTIGFGLLMLIEALKDDASTRKTRKMSAAGAAPQVRCMPAPRELVFVGSVEAGTTPAS